MVTREEIRLAYLLLLGREPEAEGCYAHHARHQDVAALRQYIVQSREGQWRLSMDMRQARDGGSFQYFRRQFVFIHIEKVGGTSLHDSLYTQFPDTRASPPHLNCIPDCTIGELNEYDFVSGHFSYQEAMALPRSVKTLICLFREPFARLISFYRFHRAHPDELCYDRLVDLAKRLSPVEFFRNKWVQASPRINNAYLQCLTGFPGRDGLVDPILMNDGLEIAYRRLATIEAIGLTERMADSVRLINAATGLSTSIEVGRANATADLPNQRAGFTPVGNIDLSPELREAIFPLVEHDVKIYEKASALFQARLVKLDPSAARRTRTASAASVVANPLSVLRKTAAQARAVVLPRRSA